jgi:hypothetical protein
VFSYLKLVINEIEGEFYKEAIKGHVGLCLTTLSRLLTPESVANIHIVNSNRTKVRSVESLVLLL